MYRGEKRTLTKCPGGQRSLQLSRHIRGQLPRVLFWDYRYPLALHRECNRERERDEQTTAWDLTTLHTLPSKTTQQTALNYGALHPICFHFNRHTSDFGVEWTKNGSFSLHYDKRSLCCSGTLNWDRLWRSHKLARGIYTALALSHNRWSWTEPQSWNVMFVAAANQPNSRVSSKLIS